MNKPLFVTGIGTGVGKTIVSAILTEQLKADYWKPVQAGDLECSDRDRVSSLVSHQQTVFHGETYRFKLAASPHKAAQFENTKIKLTDFTLPHTGNQLVIEGAGGLMVPLSDKFRMIELIQHFDAAAILVIRNYLGCINHALLSMEALVNRNIMVRGVIISGEMDEATKSILHRYFPAETYVAKIPEFKNLNKQSIQHCPDILGNYNNT
ncbi:dethiobiotin synthetase [Pedobacter sp. CAN_A7]|uniref:dethiobiotin synthase n=1 Tax=Pedobacter sp. CAN_A7 TaxID=2787722 RepID=UPI0018CB5268